MASENTKSGFEAVRQSLEQTATLGMVIGIVVVTLTAMGWLAFTRAVSLIALQ